MEEVEQEFLEAQVHEALEARQVVFQTQPRQQVGWAGRVGGSQCQL